jgi:GrpB-like predicted nucleotidyltransferase (UPF0157 family)
MTDMIVVSDYDPRWPERFEELRQRLAPHVADLAVSIEHVGSTAVPRCAAKPIIDLDIVVPEEVMPELISRLARQGYRHEGDLGIRGREAFQAPPASPGHHLYTVVAGSKPHLDHVLLRDHPLRQRPDEVQRYSALKVALAQLFPADSEGRAAYSAAKSAPVEELVAKSTQRGPPAHRDVRRTARVGDVVTHYRARAALSHPAFCGLDRAHLGGFIEELANPWMARCESALRERRGGERKRPAGAEPDHNLVFTDHILVTVVYLRLHLPQAALAELYGVTRPTVTRAIHEMRPLLAARSFAVPGRPGIRLRTLVEVFAYAEAEGVELRIDGTETQVRRPRPGAPAARRSSPARRSRTPPRPRPSATARGVCCGPEPTGPAGCTTRPPCAPRASPSSCGCIHR